MKNNRFILQATAAFILIFGLTAALVIGFNVMPTSDTPPVKASPLSTTF